MIINFQILLMRKRKYIENIYVANNGRLPGLIVHISIAPGFKPRPGYLYVKGCFIFHFASLHLEVARPF